MSPFLDFTSARITRSRTFLLPSTWILTILTLAVRGSGTGETPGRLVEGMTLNAPADPVERIKLPRAGAPAAGAVDAEAEGGVEVEDTTWEGAGVLASAEDTAPANAIRVPHLNSFLRRRTCSFIRQIDATL